MSNEAAAKDGVSGIDWANHEAVVRSALKDRCYLSKISDREGDWYRVGGEGSGGLCFWYGRRDSKTAAEAWKSARQSPTVQAFERAQNPDHAKSADNPAPAGTVQTTGYVEPNQPCEVIVIPKPFDWATATAVEKVRRSGGVLEDYVEQGIGRVFYVRFPKTGEVMRWAEIPVDAWGIACDNPSVLELERRETAAQADPQEAASPDAGEEPCPGCGGYPCCLKGLGVRHLDLDELRSTPPSPKAETVPITREQLESLRSFWAQRFNHSETWRNINAWLTQQIKEATDADSN